MSVTEMAADLAKGEGGKCMDSVAGRENFPAGMNLQAGRPDGASGPDGAVPLRTMRTTDSGSPSLKDFTGQGSWRPIWGEGNSFSGGKTVDQSDRLAV